MAWGTLIGASVGVVTGLTVIAACDEYCDDSEVEGLVLHIGVGALPGAEGTASEIRLAVQYGRPLIAWVRSSAEASALPGGVPAATSLEEVKTFIQPRVTEAV